MGKMASYLTDFLRISVCFGLAVSLMVLFLSSCGNKVVEIPEEKIPQDLREDVVSQFRGRDRYQDLKWVGYEEKGSYVFAACELTYTYTIIDRTFENRMFMIYIARIHQDGSLQMLYKGTRETGAANFFEASVAGPGFLAATGRCVDKRVHKVVGTTARGLVLESTPGQNGWWFLISEEARPDDRFDWVGGVDKSGKVVTTFCAI